MSDRTLVMIKPDAVSKNVVGPIITKFEQGGLKVAALNMLQFSQERAQEFYAVHKERPFYNDLVKFMTEGPIVAMVLQGEGAVPKARDIMGATNSKEAAPGTIRNEFGTDIERNAVHGSDSTENAAIEIKFHFPNL